MSKNKFEKMLERLVNEDREGAEALFHEIVVERSREIYQSILESEEDEDLDENEDEDLDESEDEDLDESEDEDLDESESEDEDLDENFYEFAPSASMGGDASDDMLGDIDVDDDDMDDDDGMDMDDDEMDMDDDGMGMEELEDRIDDMEAAIAQMQAELESKLSGMDDEDSMGDMDDEDGIGDEDGMGDMDDDEDDTKETFAYESKKADKAKDNAKDKKPVKKSAGEQMREYVEKVNGGFGAKIGGDNGVNTKSTVASKNDMGGTTANILRADTENSGEANKGHIKGSSLFKGTSKEDNAGNMNVPGAKAGKTAFKKTEPGHGAERKGKPESADKGAHSTIKGVVRTK
jgi:hypothetical protein